MGVNRISNKGHAYILINNELEPYLLTINE